MKGRLVLGIGSVVTALAACAGGATRTTTGGTSTSHGGSSATSTSTSTSSAVGGANAGSTSTGGDHFIFDGGITDGSMKDGDACGNVTLMQKLVPGNIVVVFDQSDSMNQPYMDADGGTAGPKYKVAEDAIVAALTPNEAQLNVGAIFFPTTATGNTCSLVDQIGTAPQIAIEPGAKFVTDFQAHFSAPGWTLILGTPTVTALTNTDTALPDPSPLIGARAVVLITDGAPTCDTKQADILAPVQAMFTRGIKTYAVGLPGSATAANLLNAIAMAGGTSTYFSPADPTALQAALASIASDTIDQCTITLNPPPADPSLVHLIVTDSQNPNGVEVPQVPSLDAGSGWTLSPDGTTATLDGQTCATAKAGGYTNIQFVYGCPTVQ